ncbi:metallophosphoesterase family protein [Prosthecobacter dejongeii]|uniref:Putative phosphodiesterase n=1 Tax=Prosthecobacter dejongeii TaxID=48465 RepID=A0A7W8DNN4_9BACT|nr:metallophosphoesterase [Prosthecobacter dejongeii]MBB5036724.1 putative phosphodiesterase [Prosthecobacter dejongeii]
MKKALILSISSLVLLGLTAADFGPSSKEDKPKKGGPGAGVEPATVPSYLFNLWLCRPSADSVTVSILSWEAMEAFITYGEKQDSLLQKTTLLKLPAGTPVNVLLSGLKADTPYFYQLVYRRGDQDWIKDVPRSFHTQRAPASPFTFAIQADSHLDTSTDVRVYQQTLKNILADRPDFMIDLGDTTMVDKFGSFYTRAESQYRAQRFYIGQMAHSIPILLTLGNHDGEQGTRLTGKPNSMPLWSLGMRKKFFPNPEPGGFYSGNAMEFEDAGLLQNYYAWEWGSALLVVLDPFWSTTQKKGGDNWSMTLGEDQYHWLTQTLERSQAPFKFVFIHHLVGGLGRDVRGGASTAPFMEWGGLNADRSEGFTKNRPGWPLPIHQLLVKNKVRIVFHGHDHLFAKEELDGIIYQEVPQPGHPSGGTRSAVEYGYQGTILGSSGHLRVTVAPELAKVEYLRVHVPGVSRENIVNGSLGFGYSIRR